MHIFISSACFVAALTAVWVAWGFYGEFMTLTAWDRKAALWGGTIVGLLFIAWTLAIVAVQQAALFVG